VAQANLIHSPKPQYPPLARAARVTGVVLLNATISKEGTIKDLRVISGHALLNDAAIEAVKQWRYKPQTLNGQAIEVITTITVNFTFQQ
jgi:protein TonB